MEKIFTFLEFMQDVIRDGGNCDIPQELIELKEIKQKNLNERLEEYFGAGGEDRTPMDIRCKACGAIPINCFFVFNIF